MSISRVLFSYLGAASLLLSASASQAAPFTVISSSQTIVDGLKRIQMVVQNGSNELNRFKVERVLPTGVDPEDLEHSLILLPALGTDANMYTIGNDPGGNDFQNSIAARFAKKGNDVYLYSPRESTLAPNACATVDCSVMATWGIQARVDDIVFIRRQIRMDHGDDKPVIGGLSLGAMTATAAINQNPNAYSGAIIWEGTLYTTNPVLRSNYQTLCDQFNGMIASGAVFDDQTGPLVQTLTFLAQTDPNGPSPFPFFPPGTTNRQAYVGFFALPQSGPPSTPFPPGFVTFAGEFATGTFVHASDNRAYATTGRFLQYAANAELRDFTCSMAGDRTFTNHLNRFDGPVLAIKGSLGFGEIMNDMLGLLNHADVEVLNYIGWGHSDLQVAPNHRQVLEKPILQWLRQDVSDDS